VEEHQPARRDRGRLSKSGGGSGATGEFGYLGGVGGKSFIDDTVPAGSAQVQYQIQAVRSTSIGHSRSSS